MEWLIALWPVGVGAVVARAIRGAHGRLAAVGAVLICGATLVASFGASDDDWIISDRDLLQAAAVWWTALWLCGVGLGAGIRRLGRRGYDLAG
jgi:hypothetical protein